MFNNWVMIYIFKNIINFPFPITVDMMVLLKNYYDMVFLLIIVFVFVSWMLFQIFFNFYKKDNAIYYGLFTTKTNHFFLEFIWTVMPMVIFFLIFMPMFKLVRVIGMSSGLTMLDSSNVELDTFGSTMKIMGNQWYWLHEYDLSSNLNNGSEFDMDRLIYSYMLDEKHMMNYNLIGDWDWDYLHSLPYVDDLSSIHDECILDLIYDSWIVDYIPDDDSWYDQESMDDSMDDYSMDGSIYNEDSFLNSTENSEVKMNTFSTTMTLMGHQYHWWPKYNVPMVDLNSKVKMNTFSTTMSLMGHQYNWCPQYDFNNRVVFDIDNSNYNVEIVD